VSHTTPTPPGGGMAYRHVPTEADKRYFIDHHRASEIPVGVLMQHLHALRAARPLLVGQARLVGYQAGDGNLLSCVLEAADPAAVMRWHSLQGLPCGAIQASEWNSARGSDSACGRLPLVSTTD
jgi:hypothetical protein